MKHLGLCALLSLASIPLLAGTINVGDRAPEIHFDKLLPEQSVSNARLEAFTGKVVVLEFWATWCGPCVSAIPHINELAEKFKDRPIVFFSLTDEEPAVVEAFLKRRPIAGLVGIAHSQSPSQIYGVAAVPATFLIDATGRIAGSTDPELLSVSMLEGLLAGRPLPAVDLMLRPHSGANVFASIHTTRNSVVMTGNLRSIISFLWDRHLSRIVGDPLEDSVVYDLSLSLPRATPETFRPWAQDVIAAALHIKVNREARDTAVWILARTKVKPAALEPGGTISDLNNLGWFPAEPPAAGGSVKLSYSDVSLIAQLLESVVKRPVLDETGITGRYDVHLSYDKSGPQGAIEALSKAGFKIEPDHRMIEFLIVTRVE